MIIYHHLLENSPNQQKKKLLQKPKISNNHTAGKEGFGVDPVGGLSKRRREGVGEGRTKAQLDDELDAFLKEDDPDAPVGSANNSVEQQSSLEDRISSRGHSKLRAWGDERQRSSLEDRLSAGHPRRGRDTSRTEASSCCLRSSTWSRK